MKRVLVTGASGLIGQEVALQLSNSCNEVHGIVNRRSPPEKLMSNVIWHKADLLNRDEVRSLLREIRPPALIHLAWTVGLSDLNSDVNRSIQAASEDLVRQFYQIGGERAVIAGSSFEYDWSNGICSEDRTDKRPNTVYGKCKNALYDFTRDFCRSNDYSWAWGRIFFVYGPNQDPARFVPSVIQGLIRQTPVLCTHGLQVRDYLHVRDVASGMLQLFESNYCGDCNIGSGKATSLRDIASEIADVLGGHELLKFGARVAPPSEPAVILADVTRLQETIRWRPRFNLTDGLADTISNWRHAGIEVGGS